MSIFGWDSTGLAPTTGEKVTEGVFVTAIGDGIGNSALLQPQTINKTKRIVLGVGCWVLGVGCHQTSPGQDFTEKVISTSVLSDHISRCKKKLKKYFFYFVTAWITSLTERGRGRSLGLLKFPTLHERQGLTLLYQESKRLSRNGVLACVGLGLGHSTYLDRRIVLAMTKKWSAFNRDHFFQR
ncbi:hypothetical protein SH449x_004204 [Pirellulaceae bacterium SH449]